MTLVGGAGASLALAGLTSNAVARRPVRRPNVVLILTDDQGYGDVGCHGNDKIRTPNLDRLCEESVEFTQFYVSPVCSPTRASLMTGRYNYRTGVVDTYLGRSMMYPDEVTLAEMLGHVGYRTGIFGKWHLGDNYPMRAMDQGFQECLVHNGGGIGQPSDPPGNRYFDPVLQHNGRPEKHEGYCTDI
ncbi:MAG: sulfatase-like hydrolase/transferase, partial [Armatimonadota bacterium]